MNIVVYLGARTGKNPLFREKARELGAWIAGQGHRLVYGGSAIGLMGELADAVLSAGGEVTGVEPRFFVDAVLQHQGVQELIVVDWPLVQKGAVSLVSEFGKTKEIFAVSKSAVIGGSFARGLGVHDFWEPLQRGVATCVGPYAAGQKETVTTLVREGVIAQLQSVSEYSRRNKPDVRLVQTFLAHESAKISDSYQQLLEFLKNLLK